MTKNHAVVMIAGSSRNRRRASITVSSLFFIGLSIIVLIPFICILVGSFQPGADIVTYGLRLTINPDRFTLDCYRNLFLGENHYFTWFKNSVLVTAIQTVCTLAITSFVAYGFSMYRFKGKNILFALVMFTMMIPFEIILLPLYQQMIQMRLINTYAGIILPFVANSLAIFFFRQYLSGISHDFVDAGRVDGCTEYGIWLRIMVPLMAPSYAAMGIFVGMNSWNNVLWPMIIINSQSKITLPVGLSSLITPYGNNYDLLIAGAVFSVLPIFVLYLFFQKYFISGLTAGGIKG
jgi:arabinosaccharide transport system permease protein